MLMTIVAKDDLEILNQCSKYLNRAGDPGASPEAWRFPIIDVSHVEPFDELDPNNEVTFVYKVAPAPRRVAVVGTFGRLYEPIRSSRSCTSARTRGTAP